MAFGSVMAGVSRHINCRLLMRPPVICSVWTASASVVAHSVGKKDATSRRASGVSRRIGVRGSLVAILLDGEFHFPIPEKYQFRSFCQGIVMILLFSKSHAAGK